VEWFGKDAENWRHLRTVSVPRALPTQPSVSLDRPIRIEPGLYVCGDHIETASIQGAMASGRRAAEAILQNVNAN